MEFRLLGLLGVGDRGREIELARGRERALLALLLLHANEPVSTDNLIEALWGDAQPENAAKTLQVYVSRLRKSLSAKRLRTTPAGYALEVATGELDTAEFERLAVEARAALESGEPAKAERLLSEALALWHGPALADFQYDSFAQPEIRRLEDLRTAARADLIDARLALGQARGVVAELEQLVDEQPLWERPRAQLMRALYASGRQADALDLYRRTRKALADEQGLEPSKELQALERAILNQDPALAAPAPAIRRAIARRGGRLLLVGGVLIAGAAALTTALLVTRGGASSLAPVAAGSVAAIDPQTNRVRASLGVADEPARLATDNRTLWVGNDDAGTVSKLEPRSLGVSRVVPTGGFPSDIAVGEGAVWVVDARRGRLTKIDPGYGTVVERRDILPAHTAYDRDREGLDPVTVAAGAGSVWLTSGTPLLVRVDPTTARINKTIEAGVRLNGVTATPTTVWAISGPAATLLEFDPQGTLRAQLPIASLPGFESPYPLAIAVGAGYVWVLNGNTATVTKIDPHQRAIVATIPIGIERLPVRISAGHGSAWVAAGDGTVSRIDAATNAVTTIPVAHRLKDVAVVGDSIWVTTGSGLTNASGGVAASANGTVGRVRALPTTSCSPLYYQAGSRPSIMIASDLPLQGPQRTSAAQMSQAIQLVLREHRFAAGRYSIAYQSCDDSTAAAGFPTQYKCEANAGAYARDRSVIAVLAPFNSFCTQFELPITNGALGGPLPLISFSNTLVGLTREAVGTAAGEPGSYYPSGARNYVRIIATDDFQGAANAVLAQRLGARRIYVLHEPFPYGVAIASAFETAGTRLGLKIVGGSSWSSRSRTYAPLALAIRRSRADAVFLAGTLFGNGDRLVNDLRAVLGPHVRLIAPDGFTPLTDVAEKIGPDAEGLTVSVAGVPIERLPRRGQEFVTAFTRAIGERPSPFSVYAAEATEVLLSAIAASDGTRESVRKALFGMHVSHGLLGNFSINSSGDTTENAITIYRIERGKPVIFTVITPPARLVR